VTLVLRKQRNRGDEQQNSEGPHKEEDPTPS
jgi:hypothetical protein